MKVLDLGDYFTFLLPEACTQENCSKYHSKIVRLFDLEKDLLVNGIQCSSLDSTCIALLNMIRIRIEGKGLKFQIVNLTKELERKHFGGLWNRSELFSIGVSEAINYFKEFVTTTAAGTFTKAFIQTTPRVLYIQTQAVSQQGKIHLKKGDLTELSGDISGIVRITTGDQHYAVILSFPAPVFLKIMSSMLGMEFTEMNSDIQDGAAELLNIIYGQARLVLKNQQKTLAAIPAVHVGKFLSTLKFEASGSVDVNSGKIIKIPFTSNFGDFFIEVWLPKDFSGEGLI